MKFFVPIGLVMVSAVCIGQTTTPEIEKVLDKKPGAGERATVQIVPKTGYEKTLAPLLDDRFVWDQFKHRTTLIWACRGSKTGQFVASSYCASQPLVDSRWPDKKIPEGYTGVGNFD